MSQLQSSVGDRCKLDFSVPLASTSSLVLPEDPRQLRRLPPSLLFSLAAKTRAPYSGILLPSRFDETYGACIDAYVALTQVIKPQATYCVQAVRSTGLWHSTAMTCPAVCMIDPHSPVRGIGGTATRVVDQVKCLWVTPRVMASLAL